MCAQTHTISNRAHLAAPRPSKNHVGAKMASFQRGMMGWSWKNENCSFVKKTLEAIFCDTTCPFLLAFAVCVSNHWGGKYLSNDGRSRFIYIYIYYILTCFYNSWKGGTECLGIVGQNGHPPVFATGTNGGILETITTGLQVNGVPLGHSLAFCRKLVK